MSCAKDLIDMMGGVMILSEKIEAKVGSNSNNVSFKIWGCGMRKRLGEKGTCLILSVLMRKEEMTT